jgi:hypothetical protein
MPASLECGWRDPTRKVCFRLPRKAGTHTYHQHSSSFYETSRWFSMTQLVSVDSPHLGFLCLRGCCLALLYISNAIPQIASIAVVCISIYRDSSKQGCAGAEQARCLPIVERRSTPLSRYSLLQVLNLVALVEPPEVKIRTVTTVRPLRHRRIQECSR